MQSREQRCQRRTETTRPMNGYGMELVVDNLSPPAGCLPIHANDRGIRTATDEVLDDSIISRATAIMAVTYEPAQMNCLSCSKNRLRADKDTACSNQSTAEICWAAVLRCLGNLNLAVTREFTAACHTSFNVTSGVSLNCAIILEQNQRRIDSQWRRFLVSVVD